MTEVLARAPQARDWQAEALSLWVSGGMRGVAEVVTGGGKTTFAGLCMRHFLTARPEGRIIVLVPTLVLVDQWHVALEADFGVSKDTIATYSGEGTPRDPSRINLMVINSARVWSERVSSTTAEAMLVVDECHRAGSPENSRALRGRHSATLGLSATPRREYDEAFDTVIAPSLGAIIYEYDYNRARADEVIAQFELRNVSIDLTAREQERYEGLSRRVASLVARWHDGQDVDTALKRALRDRAHVSSNATMRLPVAARLVEEHRGERVLVFHESIAAAEHIVRVLNERGHRTAAYHSGLGPDLRRDNLRLFRRGLFDILVSCRALDEGVNVPEASVAIIASSTASTRQRIQRLGRVLRPAPGKDLAIVYTLFATSIEEARLRREEEKLEGAERVSWIASRVELGHA